MLRLLLVLLAWSQLSMAAHQFEHSLDEAAESCSVCLLFERQDDVIPAADRKPTAPAHSPVVSVPVQADCPIGAFKPYLSRASP